MLAAAVAAFQSELESVRWQNMNGFWQEEWPFPSNISSALLLPLSNNAYLFIELSDSLATFG